MFHEENVSLDTSLDVTYLKGYLRDLWEAEERKEIGGFFFLSQLGFLICFVFVFNLDRMVSQKKKFFLRMQRLQGFFAICICNRSE